ncbi:MAG: hypothetical protein S4CHLAM45_03100 [Chlamydiales bacterium]|nr:hypothetical protein [Chlamydiales bacterium]MCH9619168.1 hypothetical protein [Chlamydiales bacterium]MCH9622430.1 hypothetical protein [Chlamydiales bacterium]
MIVFLASPFSNYLYAEECRVEAATVVELPHNEIADCGQNYNCEPAYDCGSCCGLNWCGIGLLLAAVGGAVAIIVTHNTASSH